MTITNLYLLDNVVYGTPSGNYDGSTNFFFSDAQKGVGYYRGQGSLQTVYFRLSGFVGEITVQATLDNDPELAAWFDVYNYGDSVTPISDVHPANLTGNFVWVRVAVTNFDAGTIQAVTINY